MANSVRSFAVIRQALLTGVLLFGAVCWYTAKQRGGGPQPGADADAFAAFRVLVPAACLGALVVATVLRGRVARERDPRSRDSLRMIGWAIGESSALFGAVYYYMTGDPKLYVIGVCTLLATFIILPLRET
jgi:hypothetical protein